MTNISCLLFEWFVEQGMQLSLEWSVAQPKVGIWPEGCNCGGCISGVTAFLCCSQGEGCPGIHGGGAVQEGVRIPVCARSRHDALRRAPREK